MQQIKSGEDITLKCGATEAVLLTPWSQRYQRTRFHRIGFVAELYHHGFCFTTGETEQATNGAGMGLCMEYKCPGLDDNVAPGEKWLKPGIGMLIRGDKPWLYTDETVPNGMLSELQASQDEAVFKVVSPIIHGYGYEETRQVKVEEGRLTETVSFRNTGDQPWNMTEYCHNFLSFNGERTSSLLKLILPTVLIQCDQDDGYGTVETVFGIRWNKVPEKAHLYRYPETRNAAFAWMMIHDGCGAMIGERISEQPHSMQVWENERVVCPEAFVNISVAPGFERQWKREWFFSISV